MNYMVIDCETNGLPVYRRHGEIVPADHPSQPRLASLAIILLDHELLIESERLFFIRPEGWSMTQEATEVNGLTDAHLYQDGIPILDVLGPYLDTIDSGRVVVAHNARNDLKVMRGEARRAGLDDRFEKTLNICTMMASTPIVGLKRKNGAPKWPTLEEADVFFFGRGCINAYHNALFDARATLGIFRKLKELNALPEPKIFYAKNKEALDS